MENNIDYILALKRIAYNNLNKKIETLEDFFEYVKKWWLKKYNIPKTDKRFLNMVIEDIIIEYYEDCFLNDPQTMKAYGLGYNSIEELEKARLQEELGEDFKEEVDYMVNPTTEEVENFDIVEENNGK